MHHSKAPAILLLGSLLLTASAYAQLPISAGIKGGLSLTDAFADNTVHYSPPAEVSFTRNYSDSKDYLVGPFVELRLPFGFAVEGDALYRPLSLASISPSTTGVGNIISSQRHSSWEFSLLGKYRFSHVPLIKPFVSVGPSFRATASNIDYLSKAGVTAGAGLELKLLFIRISPELRYTHWGSDGSNAYTSTGQPFSTSNRNQAELLVGLSF